ncbi:MAG: caspase family protein, partial [Thermodesulfobacteriota bacterium]|nr:caspase family protein [Thermodesulfobacteriota bacterium]
MANYAILIGVSHYYDQQIKDLPHSVHSIKQLHDTLIEKGSFEPTNILVLTEKVNGLDPLTMPFKYTIISTLLNIYRRWPIEKDDFLLFYFMGHGYGSVKGDQILTMDTCFQYLRETALSTGALTKLIRPIRAQRKLLVFDSCRNEVEGTQGTQEGLGKKRIDEFITLYACMPGEQAYIPRKDKLPLLTSAFIKAVKDSRCLSIRDMYNFVCDSVQAKSYEIAVRQTPELAAGGKELDKVSFLSKILRTAADVNVKAGFENQIIEANQSLHYLYKEKYPRYAPSYTPFMNAARKLKDWRQKINQRVFRKVAFSLLEKGEDADIYTVSYMLRWGSDAILFKPLTECLASRKYRGTVVWQAMDALEVILRNEQTLKWLTVDEQLKESLVTSLRRSAEEHPTKKGTAFASSVVWGKIL